jgi:hypothetical protein
MTHVTPQPDRLSDESGADLARAVALMQIAGRRRTLIRAGRTRVSVALSAASAATWTYALLESVAALRGG